MGRPLRAVLVGARKVGKSTIAVQLSKGEDLTSKPYQPSVGDSYIVNVEHDKSKDFLIVYDTAGLESATTAIRPLLYSADFVLFVCSALQPASIDHFDSVYHCVEQMQKDKKDMTLYVLINHSNSTADGCEKTVALIYAKCQKEKVRCFRVDPTSSKSVVETFQVILNKFFSAKDNRFLLPKKSKEKAPGAAILLDF